MEDKLYSFVFRGLLTESALDGTGRISKHANFSILNKEIAERLSIDLLDENYVERAKRMATVYTAITAFENSVREFIVTKLLEEVGENWWETCVSEKIRTKALSRREEEIKVRWHTPRGESMINYTEFGDLTAIMIQNWSHFEYHIQSQEWARQLINTLERSRNVIMHSGELGNEDIERIGTQIRDWIRQVGA